MLVKRVIPTIRGSKFRRSIKQQRTIADSFIVTSGIIHMYSESAICTIIVIYRQHPDFPLIVAANRDEFYARPATTPHRQGGIGAAFYSGIDLKAGGTWLGATEKGFLVGLTNRREQQPPKQGVTSRGELVFEALRHGSTEKLLQRLQAPFDSNPFNLVFGTASSLFIASAAEPQTRIDVQSLPPGIHVIGNREPNDLELFKTGHNKTRVEAILGNGWPDFRARLMAVLGDRTKADLPDPVPPWLGDWGLTLSSTFIDGGEYGTCSSSIIAMSDNRLEEYWHANQRPGVSSRGDFRRSNSVD